MTDFRGFTNIKELECSGEVLESTFDVLSMSLFTPLNDKVSVSVNVRTNQCLTSDSFSLCDIDTGSSRLSKIRTLVLDLKESESRVYGCNVTCFVSGGRVKTVTWFTTVHRSSKYR